MERLLATIFVLIIPGLFLVIYHIRLLNGNGNKAMYMADHIYAGRVYIGLPGGIMLLIWAIATIPQSSSVAAFIIWIGLGFGALGLIFSFVQPDFLKPAWYKWIEKNHSDIKPILLNEIRAMGDHEWNQQVTTQAEIEKWVTEVREKYRLLN